MNMRTQATAFTLMEVMISMTILITAIAMVMQGLVSGTRLNAVGNAQDDIAFDADKVMAAISSDLSLSGWDGVGGAGASYSADRGNYYLPYVTQEAVTDSGGNLLDQGLGSSFAFSRRADVMVGLNLPETLPGVPEDFTTNFDESAAADRRRYLDSFHARSQELHFLRIAAGPWGPQPQSHTQLHTRFAEGDWADTSSANRAALGILHPSAWAESALNSGIFDRRTDPAAFDAFGTMTYGHILYGGRLNIVGGDITLIPRWETVDPPDYLNPAADEWREYQYAVIPTRNGIGRLVRAIKVRMASVPTPTAGGEVGEFITPLGQTFGMQVQQVLSDHVARVVFNTFRTDPGLELNQIGVRIYFARASILDPTLVLTRIVDTVIAMRTRASESDASEIQVWVNNTVGFDY